MKSDIDNSWLDPLLAQQVGHEPAEFDFTRWSQEHPEEARLLEHGSADTGRSRRTSTYLIWRCIMESKVTRYSAAAVVALAGALVLLSPFGTTKNGGVALAAVREKVAQVNTMVLRGEKVFSPVADPNIVFRFDVVKYFSRQYGHVEEGRMSGALAYRIVFNLPEKQCLILFPMWKKCLKRPCTEEQIKLLEKLTAVGVTDLLLETYCRKLGPAQIDGVAAEGFEMPDVKPIQNILPKYLFDIQQGSGTVWVSTRDLLPIRIEGDLLIGKSLATLFTDLHLHEVATLESHDVELEEGLFNTDIPEGYTEFQLSDVLPVKLSLAGLGVLPGMVGV
jgi:hypothetical protein